MRLSRCLLTAMAAISPGLSNGLVVQPRPAATSSSLRSSSALKISLNGDNDDSRIVSTSALQMSDTVSDAIETTFDSSDDSKSSPTAIDYNSAELVADLESIQSDKDRRIDSVVFANAFVIGSILLSTAYCLMHTQVEALLALWEYDLGPHGPDLTKAAVAFDLFARLPVDAIRSYEALVPTNPIFYKACTSGVAYALGDFISQVYQGRTMSDIDLPRSARSGAAGFIGHGPLCHYWLCFMETYLDFGGAWWATGIKVTADLTVWSIFLSASYSFIIGMLQLRDPRDVWEDVKTTTWPALRSAWRFWPFVHTVSFSHAVPMDLKLLWVDVMEVVWVTILSKVANEDKNAKRKAEEAVETLDVVESFNARPDLEIELTREAELAGTNKDLAFELPKKVLMACWPLIAMWPVLYAGYQVERYFGLEV